MSPEQLAAPEGNAPRSPARTAGARPGASIPRRTPAGAWLLAAALGLSAGAACAGAGAGERPASGSGVHGAGGTGPWADDLAALVAARAGVPAAPALDPLESGRDPGRDPGATPADSLDAWLAAAPALTADAAAAIALARHPAMLADLDDLGVARATLAQALRPGNPSFAAAWRRSTPGGGTSIDLGASVPLLDLVLLPARRRLAAAEYEAARLRIGQRMLDRAGEAKAAVHRLEAAGQRLERRELIRGLDEAAARLAERMEAAGNLSSLDVARHRARLAESDLAVAQAGLAVARAREGVRRALGLSGAERPWRAAARLAEPPGEEPPFSGLEERALAERLDLAAARFAVAAVDRAAALGRRTRWFPAGIAVGVDRERDADGSRLTGPTLQLQLPLFDTGRARRDALEAERRRARRQLETVELEARSRLREAHATMSVARQLLAFQRDSILPERLRILDETVRRYNMMLAGTYDVLEARRREVEAEEMLIDTWLDYWLARVALERELGGPLPLPAAEDGESPPLASLAPSITPTLALPGGGS